MRKFIKYKALVWAVVLTTAISCDQEQEVDPIGDHSTKANITIAHVSGPTSGTVSESEGATIIYDVTIDKMVNFAVTVSARQVGGTADDHDYTVTAASIAPYSTTGQIKITIDEDADVEDLETLELEVAPLNEANNFQLNMSQVTPQKINLSIENTTPEPAPNDFIHVVANWEGEAWPADGSPLNGCDLADIDIYVLDETLNFNVEYTEYGGATGSCPESFDLDLSGAPNGTYYVVADLYEVADVGDFGPVEFSIALTFSREMDNGDAIGTIEVGQLHDIMTTEPGSPVTIIIGTINYEDGVYTILDQNDEDQGSLRVAPNLLQERLKKFRKSQPKTF